MITFPFAKNVSHLRIRKSEVEDAVELAKLTRTMVRTVNAQDHSEEIIKTWSAGKNRFVAIKSAEISGFSDMLPNGELTSLYVHPKHLGKGFGKRLLAHIEKKQKLWELN